MRRQVAPGGAAKAGPGPRRARTPRVATRRRQIRAGTHQPSAFLAAFRLQQPGAHWALPSESCSPGGAGGELLSSGGRNGAGAALSEHGRAGTGAGCLCGELRGPHCRWAARCPLVLLERPAAGGRPGHLGRRSRASRFRRRKTEGLGIVSPSAGPHRTVDESYGEVNSYRQEPSFRGPSTAEVLR